MGRVVRDNAPRTLSNGKAHEFVADADDQRLAADGGVRSDVVA
jgi:hypothetical protein